ncbi:hypothetical protein ACFL00_02350 [Pseudomonadota bacterium]
MRVVTRKQRFIPAGLPSMPEISAPVSARELTEVMKGSRSISPFSTILYSVLNILASHSFHRFNYFKNAEPIPGLQVHDMGPIVCFAEIANRHVVPDTAAIRRIRRERTTGFTVHRDFPFPGF